MLFDIYLRKLKKAKVSWYNMNYYLMTNIVRVELSGVEGSAKLGS